MKKIAFSTRYGLEQAVIARTKTMTRRIIPPIEINWARRGKVTLPVSGYRYRTLWVDCRQFLPDSSPFDYVAPQKYQPAYDFDEEVAVAQRYEECWKFYQQQWESKKDPSDWRTPDAILGDQVGLTPGWTNKMFVKADLMPHRIRITDIRVERLQDISEADIVEEGIRMRFEKGQTKPYFTFPKWDDNDPSTIFLTPRDAFAALIDRISGRGTWERNPWVFVYSFELIR